MHKNVYGRKSNNVIPGIKFLSQKRNNLIPAPGSVCVMNVIVCFPFFVCNIYRFLILDHLRVHILHFKFVMYKFMGVLFFTLVLMGLASPLAIK